jgi:serine/threonine protein kinase
MRPTANAILRRADTPTTHPSHTGVASGALPEELVADQLTRLALFAVVGASLWTFGLITEVVLTPLVLSGTMSPFIIRAIHVAAIAVAALMYLYVRYAPHTPETKRTVGLAFFLANCAGVAALNTVGQNGWTMPAAGPPVFRLSWNAVAILVFSMIASATPRQLILATLLGASLDPLGVWIAHLRGVSVPSLAYTLVLYLPNYMCALVGLMPSTMLHRLGTKLRRAQELGSYRLLERLGQGGMGEVWRAEHRLLARSAAVKLIRPDMLGTSSADDARRVLVRFEREARATASLHSPHTIQVFDFGTTGDGSFYYVMELLGGRDLESLVREFGPVPAQRAIFLMRQVCHSLADAHARGLVHRDIKPANIYVCRMGLEYDFVKVLDFGLVKMPDRESITRTLTTGDQRTSGTPAYMAPEVILGNADVDRRADVYAMGCVAYFLLTGQLVFEANTSMKMLLQHVNDTPIPPSQRSEMPIPHELDALVLSCLEKDPNKRPQNAEELFRMALCCTSCEGWNNDTAKAWWTTHLPDLCGPLTVDAFSPDARQATSRLPGAPALQ